MASGTNFLEQWCLILLIRGSQSLFCWPRTWPLDSLFTCSRSSTSEKHHAPITHTNSSQVVYLRARTTKFTLQTLPHTQRRDPRGSQERGTLGSYQINQLIWCTCSVSKMTLVCLLQNITILFVLFSKFLQQWSVPAHWAVFSDYFKQHFVR